MKRRQQEDEQATILQKKKGEFYVSVIHQSWKYVRVKSVNNKSTKGSTRTGRSNKVIKDSEETDRER